jgi:hypothetical protein
VVRQQTVVPGPSDADDSVVEQIRPTSGATRSTSSRALPDLAAVLAMAYSTELAARPEGLAWERFYDVVLYDAVYVTTTLAC